MYREQTYEVIKQRILDNININIDKREGSFTNNMISPTSVELAKVYISQGDLLSIAFIEDTHGEFLDMRVGEFGVYRKLGKKASGEIKVTGEIGTHIPNSSILVVNDLVFILLNDIVIGEEDIGYIEAVEVGRKYNLLPNTKLDLKENIDGINSILTSNEFINGIDIETDTELRDRYKKVVNNPSTSGNEAHYEEWALEVDGVNRAIPYPRWNGRGTVKVMIVGKENKPVIQSVIEECKAHIEECMPIGPTITVITPSIMNISIKANIKVTKGHSIESIKSEFEESVQEYLSKSIDSITYTKIMGILANMVSVTDFNNLLVNDSTENITINEDNIAELSEVVLDAIN